MIQKLTKEEVAGILPIKHKKSTLLHVMLKQLELGEGLFLPATDWHRKHSPYYIVHYLKKKKGLRFEYGKKADGSGWLFKRIK